MVFLSGQVLHCPYDFEKAKLVVKEMTDQMVLDLVDKKLVTDQIVLTVGYDIENLNKSYRGHILPASLHIPFQLSRNQ